MSDDHRVVTPPSSTITRSFSGALEVGDQTVPATIVFGERSVSLSVAGDTVGEWPASEVEVVPVGNLFDIHAEGDAVRFMPDESADFGAFITTPAVEPVGSEAPAIEPERLEQSEVAPTSAATLFDEPLLEPEIPDLGFDLETSEAVDAEAPQLALDDAPDEFFAAGLNGPPTENGPPAFRPVVLDSSPVEEPAEEVPAPAMEGEHDGWPPLVSEVPPAPPIDVPAESEPDPAPDEARVDEAAVEDRSSTSRLSRFIKRARESGGGDTEPAPRQPEPDDTPEPITDAENIRQWGLVVAGGVVLLAIVGIVAWGLISLMGGDEPSTDAVESPSTTVAAVAPTVQQTTPTTVAPSTTVGAENRAAAAGFVADWNGLAAEYAYHMTISAESLPISTAPTGSVHLTYGEDGILVLNMVPEGGGGDRDILVAMGMAIAWADPGLSPEGRKQLLGALGVDVDNPQLNDLGGELDRNGVVYRVSVSEGIIRFEVAPRA